MIDCKKLNLSIPESIKKGDPLSGKQKLLIIGLDGISLNIIDPLINEKLLPNVKRIMDKGTCFRHNSSPFFQSYNAWTVLVTGTNSAKNGIYSYETKAKGGNKFLATNTNLRANKAYWNILSDYGKKVVVLDIPATYPPEEINGVMITSLYTPQDVCFTHPKNLSSELTNCGFSPRPPEVHTLERHHVRLREISGLAKYLQENADWDCLTVCFAITDAFHHLFGSKKEELKKFYIEIDKQIGELTENLDSNTAIIICSDHGSSFYDKEVFLERWLYREGFLKLKEGKQLEAFIRDKEIKENNLRKKKTDSVLKYWISLLLKKYLRFKARYNLPKIPFLKFPDWAITWKCELVGTLPYDWDKTISYLSGGDVTHGNVCGLWLNDKMELGNLVNKLLNLSNQETGEKIVTNIFRREEIFKGKYLERIPHLLVQFKEGYHVSFSSEIADLKSSRVIEKLQKPELSHYPEGLFIFFGGNFKHSNGIMDCSIMDLVPTILFYLGLSVPSYLDGKVLTQVFSQDFLDSHQPTIKEEEGYLSEKDSQEHLSEIDQEIKKELQKMGYIRR